MSISYITIKDDLGMQYSDREQPEGSIFLEMTAYNREGERVGSLSEIEFFEDGKDWIRGNFWYVLQIPERCDHLRQVARDLGLPEGRSDQPPSMSCREALLVIDEMMRDVAAPSFEEATHWDRRMILPKDREALRTIQAIIDQLGCEHFDAQGTVKDGRLTTLMDIVIFG